MRRFSKFSRSIKGKIALITGAASGMGKATAELFSDEGAVVIVTDLDQTSVDRTVNEIKKHGYHSEGFVLDVSNKSNIREIVKIIKDRFGCLDILINNAGITGPTDPLWKYDVEMWNKIVQINLMGTFNCCRAIVPNMIKNNYGRIVNVASVAGKDGNANASAYSSAKAGAIGLTKALGKELADKDIAVNAVTPAGAKTRILDQMSKEHVQRMLSKVPRGRFLEIHEFTSLVCWLSSQENTFSTAAVFDISGGRSTY